MKKAIKNLYMKKYAVSPGKIVPIIEKSNCKAVSFDIFDTLLKRNVPAPEDVFVLLEQQYKHHFGGNKHIHEWRSQAENRAVQLKGYRDVNLQEIYQAITEINDEEREWLITEEIQIEKTVCQRWNPMGQVYDWCIKEGIPVVLVSDMYLPREVITDILCAAGYTGWKRLYISAEEHANKVNGTLFNVALNKEQLKPEELLHIGDSLRGDYLTPCQIGMQAVLIVHRCGERYFNRSQYNKEKKKSQLAYRIVDSLIKNNIDRYESLYQRLGYAVVGPILYGYCKWLYKQADKSNIKKLFFLAREGYFLKRGFDLLDYKDICSDVIQVSRKATTRPILHRAQNLEELLCMMEFDHDCSIEKILNFGRLDEQQILPFLKENGLRITDNISTISDEKKDKFFEYAKPLIDKISLEQEENIRGYLLQRGFTGSLAICDVGWLGTIQNSLQTIFQDIEMMGYYVGKREMHNKPKVKSDAFLFDQKVNHEIFQTVIGTVDLFELFFLSADGSASHYIQDSKGKYICRELPPEQEASSARCIMELQDAACDFVRDLKYLDGKLDIEMDPCTSSAGYRSFIMHIDNDTIQQLKKFTFLNIKKRTLFASHSLGWYIFRPRIFVRDYLNTGCRAIFLKSVFRIPFPYVQVVECFRRLVENWRICETNIKAFRRSRGA